MTGVFVTGTDTDVGKTVVAAWLASNWQAEYWKPVQSGMVDGSDSACVAALAPGTVIHPSAYTLQAPLSPHEAARHENLRIELAAITPPATTAPLVVEGAGGVLVPLNDTELMIDLIAHLGLPALVVARSTLGTINHTLLTLEALARRSLPVLGVVLNGPPSPANHQAIERFGGGVRVLAELPHLAAVNSAFLNGLPPPVFAPPAARRA